MVKMGGYETKWKGKRLMPQTMHQFSYTHKCYRETESEFIGNHHMVTRKCRTRSSQKVTIEETGVIGLRHHGHFVHESLQFQLL
jgi:hypothetical protein